MKMDLLLVRHGLADPRSAEVVDSSRRLTKEGRRRFRLSVREMERMRVLPDAVLSSPWHRALETAELLAETAGVKVASTELLAAAPGDELLAVVGGLGAERTALVGHQPWLGELLALLTVGQGLDEAFRFKKGGFAWLRGELAPGSMRLRALVPPPPALSRARRSGSPWPPTVLPVRLCGR